MFTKIHFIITVHIERSVREESIAISEKNTFLLHGEFIVDTFNPLNKRLIRAFHYHL